MESCWQEDFSETSAVHKGEFRNFLNIGVAKVYTLKQSATVTRMCSDSFKMLCESKCGDSRSAKAARCYSPVLACGADPRGDGSSLKVYKLSKVNTPLKEVLSKLGFAIEPICNPFRCIHPLQGTTSAKALYPNSRHPGAKTLFSSLQSRKTSSEMPTTTSAVLPSLCSNEPDA